MSCNYFKNISAWYFVLTIQILFRNLNAINCVGPQSATVDMVQMNSDRCTPLTCGNRHTISP